MLYPRFAELPALLEAKLITKRPHPKHPIFIYNYSPSAQHLNPSKWTKALSECRGLILDKDGEIVGRGFEKFWNIETVQDQASLEGSNYEVLEKMDGSLILVCWYKGDRIVATRGSFESDQAKWANEWLLLHDTIAAEDEEYVPFMPKPGETWLFEAIYPANRIVVDYKDFNGLVWLDTLHQNGKSIKYFCTSYFEEMSGDICHYPFKEAKVYTKAEMDEMLANPPENHEGFVLRWPSGFRCKVKFAEYKRLHRLLTQCSTTVIWDMLRNNHGKPGSAISEILDRVPEGFAKWATETASELWSQYDKIEDQAELHFGDICRRMFIDPVADGVVVDRKMFASYATKLAAPYPALMFASLDGKSDSFQEIIWKHIKPKWSKPFVTEAD